MTYPRTKNRAYTYEIHNPLLCSLKSHLNLAFILCCWVFHQLQDGKLVETCAFSKAKQLGWYSVIPGEMPQVCKKFLHFPNLELTKVSVRCSLPIRHCIFLFLIFINKKKHTLWFIKVYLNQYADLPCVPLGKWR